MGSGEDRSKRVDENDPLVEAAKSDSPAEFMEAVRQRVVAFAAEDRARHMAAVHSPATPKALRPRVEVTPAPALTDPLVTLGHAPRPRKRKR